MSFAKFGLKKFVNDVIKKSGFVEPTEIQNEVIPLIKKHKNVIALAHTGTGKTHAFLLPVVNNLDFQNSNSVQAAIVAPTRELAKQIYDNLKIFSLENNDLTTGLYIGGTDIHRDIASLSKSQPMVVVGTPTRLKDLYLNNALFLTTTNYVVVDECDMIFDLGFLEDLDFLLSKMKKEVVLTFFSATINKQLQQYLKKYLKNAFFVDVTKKKIANQNIQHLLIDTKNRDLEETFGKIIQAINPYLCLIFVNNKHQISAIVNYLHDLGVQLVGELHGDLKPRTRMAMLKKIKNNDFKYVVATDVVARGVDIEGVSHVISINLPIDASYYIHRAGRTGRKDFLGKSYVLANLENQVQIDALKHKGIEFQIMKFINQDLVAVEQKKSTSPSKPLDNETQAIINKYKNVKVKPGYKKKRKAELEKLKKERRRENIKKSIAKIKKEKYKKRRHEIFDD